MWTTGECYAPNATADAATEDTVKAEHATTRKTRTNETDYPSPSCPPNTLTHGKSSTAIQQQKKSGTQRKAGNRREEGKTTRQHTTKERGKKRQATRTTHPSHHPTPPPFRPTHKPPPPFHNDATLTQHTTLNQQCCDSKHKHRGAVKKAGTTQDAGPNLRTGRYTTHHSPPFNKTATPNGRGAPTLDGRDSNTAPAPHSPCHPPYNATPPSTMPPPATTVRGGADGGYPTTQTSTDTHYPHTTHQAENSTRHDSSTHHHCSGMSRAWGTPLDSAG